MENVACFQCEHCGYSTNIKQTFHRHLQRKTPCNLEVANVHIKPIIFRQVNYGTPTMSKVYRLPNPESRLTHGMTPSGT
jgi:hypothetical protein